MSYLLDTNAWIAFLRGRNAALIQRLHHSDPASVFLCTVVLAELIHGAHKSGPVHCAANLGLIAKLRQRFVCHAFDEAAAEVWGPIRNELGQQGLLIGPHDLMIASIALARNLVLVTHNTREFHRVPSLVIEDWQAP